MLERMHLPTLDNTPKVMPIRVKSVRRIKLAKPIDVCDLSVPKYENFALASGVFVHNCRQARMKHHEILMLRGVSINAQRQDSSRVLANKEIRLLIKALGIKPGEKDLSKMRVGSITILTDADPDGKHIASLLLAFFKVYYPEIVRQKKLRYVNGPLFMGQVKENRIFGDSKDEIVSKFPAGIRAQIRMTRFKGWGEATAEQLESIAFDPKTRRLVVLSMSDSDELRIGTVMGKDADVRKELLFKTSSNDGEA
jgi:topoisomerase-4 subunit B